MVWLDDQSGERNVPPHVPGGPGEWRLRDRVEQCAGGKVRRQVRDAMIVRHKSGRKRGVRTPARHKRAAFMIEGSLQRAVQANPMGLLGVYGTGGERVRLNLFSWMNIGAHNYMILLR